MAIPAAPYLGLRSIDYDRCELKSIELDGLFHELTFVGMGRSAKPLGKVKRKLRRCVSQL